MNWTRMWTIFVARNREFYRDRAAFGWNFLFPFFIIIGFGIIFGGENRPLYKIGVFPSSQEMANPQEWQMPGDLKRIKYIQFIGLESKKSGLEKLQHHKIDLLLEKGTGAVHYWISSTSPGGYITEQILKGSLLGSSDFPKLFKESIHGREIRYIDWLFPGILAMNMMFSALWGVGYIIVRYRKNGVLKRLSATPITALEYLSAQMLSRLFVLLSSTVIVWIGCDLIFHFQMLGSYTTVFFLFFLGSCSLCSLGILMAARGTSEEFASGLLNFITWPMMFLSEVWFSLEGAPQWVKKFAALFPLTHLNNAVRKVMNDGATLSGIGLEITFLTGFTVICLAIGAWLFSWHE